MQSVLDNSLVGLALLVSAGYAILSLGPRSLRRRTFAAFSRLTGRAPIWLGLGRIAQRFAVASNGKAQGACGGCDNCGSEPAGELKAPIDDLKSPAAEVRVPVAKVGRRA